ncbi:hypothetical protein ABGT15_10540 [Flavobacterium enshiense]|uniref:hypothetical protein n=1 Tax=Flavobacterium enshiense TaxID=1341165 RepID=UPI00345CF3A0
MKKVLLLLLSVSLFSCSNDEDSAQPAPSNEIAYFRASLNGEALNYSQTSYTASSTHEYGYSNGFSMNGFDRAFYYGCVMRPTTSIEFYPQIDLTFTGLITTADYSAETAGFYDAFALTALPTNFVTMAQENDGVKGVYVHYESTDGTRYSSLSGDQTGSTVAYTSSTSGTEGGLKTQTVTGTVSCKLYNESNPSDVIVLTNGQYKLNYIEFD